MGLQILDYSDKTLILMGDLHGEFRKLYGALKNYYNTRHRRRKRDEENDAFSDLKNVAILVCGDCGFGFNKSEYYNLELRRLQDVLEKNNNVILWLRGNHDDPFYFQTFNGHFDFPNIKFVPDYTILKTADGVTLCIGGAISYDRSWRIKENERSNRYSRTFKKLWYWENEKVKDNPDLISDLKESGIKIDSIVTHTIPFSFLKDPKYNGFLKDNPWYKLDKVLKEETEKESELLENIFKELTDNGQEIKWWGFGHTHLANIKEETLPDGKKIILFNLPEFEFISFFKHSTLYHSLGGGILKVKSGLDYFKRTKELGEMKISENIIGQYIMPDPLDFGYIDIGQPF